MQTIDELNIPNFQMLIQDGRPRYSHQRYIAYYSVLQGTEYGQSILQTMMDDCRIKALEGNLLAAGSIMTAAQPMELAMWFIWYAKRHGEKTAQEALDQWFATDTHEIQNTLWVVGLELEQSLHLPNGISITPINDLPDSDEKEDYLTVSRDRIGPHQRRLPTCAITKTISIRKFWSEADVAAGAYFSEYQKQSQPLFDVAMLINCLHGVVCVPYYHTSYMLEQYPLGHFGGRGAAIPLSDVSTDIWGRLNSDSFPVLTQLVASFDNREERDKEKLRLILSRLSQAKRRSQATDKVLDLGIALEMLLLDESKNDQISLVFRLRGSWLLGADTVDRANKYDLLNNLYGARSAVAHNGTLPRRRNGGIHDGNFQEVFPQYEALAADITQKIILNGWPNWKELVLGGAMSVHVDGN
ncbi:HEPN domain-containing protein [Aquitalea sp. ASV11]|uniref:HEPN domain-containing protein n=1 Tax=Aquitalea sp. ASV11 TaxID=2795103 RepID=UPI0018EADB23|nr:HEPN domain-containing protein [Aquitalea sp. ASV11]